ncbi:NmrA family NAD(P)-binding protein [Rouxiella silvae]|uniref:NmrA family NAD(P)-binding protein n=1 Tax=Rouxiella silvae TaxID=1646373 RepID=A0AA40X291_9GAMM|nr:NmrA family NAD(P)-binding protein [Rouxiella silvae]MBF6637356.1 NmrA family NAD(P)-binding protein [Rouxiella silvae]
MKTVAVMGASGTLGTSIVRMLLDRGVHVRALVRATTHRAKLEALGVTDFVVADLMDPISLQGALTQGPRIDAVISSAAGFTSHSRRTKDNDIRADIEGYRHWVDAAKIAQVPRFIFISILECDKAPNVPHFHKKRLTEQYLVEKQQPYLSLRAAAFLDRPRDVVAEKVKSGVFPDIAPGVAMDMIYSPDLARYAVEAALDLPDSAFNQCIDICCDIPATGPMLAAAFTRVLGRPIVAKPAFSSLLTPLMPLIAKIVPSLRDGVAVLFWIRKGGYVTHDRQTQEKWFGKLPTIEDSVTRYCQERKF